MKVLLFDEECLLCNRTVQFVLKRDKNNHIKIGTLQSEKGQALLKKFQFNGSDLTTFTYLDGDQLFVKSDASLAVLNDLGGLYRLARIFKIIPRSIRDSIYMFVSRNRYKWFGKTDRCVMMNDQWKDRLFE